MFMWIVLAVVVAFFSISACIDYYKDRKRRINNPRLIAAHSTYLYEWARQVYYKMDDGCVRFLALYIQTASVRREIFPVKEIISWAISSVNYGQSWHDLCMRLILEWDKRITHKGMNIWEEMELKKIAEESSLNYSTSGAKYEEVVRSISRISCASLVAKYETQKEAKERFMKVRSAVDFVAESLR